MRTFKLFVVGPFGAGKTAFIRAMSEIDIVSTETDRDEIANQRIAALDFGRLTLSDDTALYLFGHPSGVRMEQTFEYLGKRGLPLSETGFIVIMNSASPDADRENGHFLQYIHKQNRPYLVALSKQDLPNARPSQQMREVLAIPDEIKVLGYDWKDPISAKKVALELVKLFPEDDIVEKVIEGLKAQISSEK